MDFWEKVFYICAIVLLQSIAAILIIFIYIGLDAFVPIPQRKFVIEIQDKRRDPLDCIEEGVDGWKMWSIDHPSAK